MNAFPPLTSGSSAPGTANLTAAQLHRREHAQALIRDGPMMQYNDAAGKLIMTRTRLWHLGYRPGLTSPGMVTREMRHLLANVDGLEIQMKAALQTAAKMEEKWKDRELKEVLRKEKWQKMKGFVKRLCFWIPAE